MKWKLIVLAGIFVGIFALLPNLARIVGWAIEIAPWVFYAVVFAGILLGVSAFLPYGWGRILRSISYISLFIAILGLEIGVMASMVAEYPKPKLEECKALFPEETKGIAWDALFAASCIFTGYFPVEYTALGFATFFIFYLLLPFAFIFAYIYGIMFGLHLDEWFGVVGRNVIGVISFVISLYAMRVMFGAFLLEFLGYGAWGLAGVFGAIFIVKGLEHMINKWYRVEEELFAAKKELEKLMEARKKALKTAIDFVKKEDLSDEDLHAMITRGTKQWNTFFKYLDPAIQNRITDIVTGPEELEDKRKKILKVLRGG